MDTALLYLGSWYHQYRILHHPTFLLQSLHIKQATSLLHNLGKSSSLQLLHCTAAPPYFADTILYASRLRLAFLSYRPCTYAISTRKKSKYR